MSENSEHLSSGIWIAGLGRFAGLGNRILCQLIEYAGSADLLYQMNTKTILEFIAGPPEKVVKASVFLKDENRKKNSQEEGIRHAKNGMSVLEYTSDLYPSKLKMISSTPALLFVSGENYASILKEKYSVAIIGTRSPTAYGEAVTKKIVQELAIRNIVIVSGMARGIDSLAHQTTLDKNGMTIAVLGCGLDIVYPPENHRLMHRIMERGVLVSECPPGIKPMKSYFPARNRIISGLSDSVAVMEASKKSGTMITAGFAGDQGKDLYAVPGSIFSTHSTGTNQLIQDGACVLTSAEDMLWKLPLQTIQQIVQTTEVQKKALECNSTEKSKTVQTVLKNTEKTMDEIALELGLPIPKISEILSVMELSGELIFRNGRFSLTDSYK